MTRLRPYPSRLLRGMIAVVSVLAGASPALATVFGSIEVVAQPQPAAEGSSLAMRTGGYIEFRLVVSNHSKTADHLVRLIQPASPTVFYNDYLARNSRTVRVAHGEKLAVSLFQPILTVTQQTLGVEIDGLEQEGFVELPSPFGGAFGYGSGARPPLAVLASRGIPQELRDNVRDAHPNEIAFCRSEIPVGEWSPHWLGYTAYDVLLMTEQEAGSLPAEVLLALRRYVEAGGILLVQRGVPYSKKLIPEALRDPDVAANDDDFFAVGFGQVGPCPTTTPWPGEFWIARSKGNLPPQDRTVQIVTEINVPVRGLLVVVIFFAIGIGPVNVWLLSRRQKRMWLWWNVPAMSLATCLMVFAYSLFAEGISGRGRMGLITLLDENTHRATTVGYTSYYCPLTPSDGLHFSYDTEVVQLHANEVAGFRGVRGRGKTVDWTNDQHLESGWVVAGVPACFAIRKSETRRERLAVHKAADGSTTVVNGLGVEIDSLYYVDPSGVVGVGTEIPPGQERTLELRKSGTPADEIRPLRVLFDQAWNVSLQELKTSPEKYVTPGCYLAVVKQSPFVEDPLVASAQEKSTGVIYGIGARVGNGR